MLIGMAKSVERIKACQMRREGESIKEIAKMLGVSSGSVSKWTCDVELTEAQRDYLRSRQIASGQRGRMMGAEMNRAKRLERMRIAEIEAAAKIQKLSKQDLFYIGLGLYWGEGSKAKGSSLAITNSDPKVISLMIRWFEECFGLPKDRFRPRIFISDVHRNRSEIILNFWTQITGIPRSQFRRLVFLDKGKKLYENHDTYFGVMALQVAKGGDIKYKVLAQIERIAQLAPMPA